jgi:hypothetical protein
MPVAAPIDSRAKQVRLVLPPLHLVQQQIVTDPHRIVVAAMGSKFGKSHSMATWLLLEAWNRNQSLNWWVAPILRQARIGFNTITKFLPPQDTGRVRINRGDMVVELLNTNGSVRSVIEFRSGDDPGTLRGEGVHAAVLDEAAYLSEEALTSVMTTTTRTRGKLRIISTPCGKNWFYDHWLKGATDEARLNHPEYMSYRAPTSANPFISTEMLEQFKKNMPERVYRQDILAEFLEDGGTVFHNLATCQKSTLTDRPYSSHFVVGIDLAKHEDYTVIVVMDWQTKQVVNIQRYNGVDWNINIDRCIRVAREWNNATMIMDATGVGDVPYDSVRAVYPHVIPYKISGNNEKLQLIQKLQFAFERGEIGIPNPPLQARADQRAVAEVLMHELNAYSYDLTPSGKYAFSAPVGQHDDTVIALALANWQAGITPQGYTFRQRAGI